MPSNALLPLILCTVSNLNFSFHNIMQLLIHTHPPFFLPSSFSTQDFPNYKYRPRRKKRDGQKGNGQQSNTNNNSSSINNNRSNGGSPASLIEKSELLEEKLEKVNFTILFTFSVFDPSSRLRV